MQYNKLVNAFIEIVVVEKKKPLNHSGKMYRLIEKVKRSKAVLDFRT